MKVKFYGRAVISLIIISLLILPTFLQAEKQKIRVVVMNASIRLQPNMESEVIDNPPVGSVFEVERKIGEWYEVRYQSKVGVMITAYIHEMLVELESAAPRPERKVTPQPRREVIRRTPPSPPIRHQPQRVRFPKFEFILTGGYCLGYSLTENLSYSYDWSYWLLDSVTESGELAQKLSKPFGLGAAFNILFTESLGIQLRFDYNTKSSFTDDSSSSYNIIWEWFDRSSYSGEEEWTVEGDVSLLTISGNLIYRIPVSGMIVPSFSAGLTYFSGNMEADTTQGYALTWTEGDWQYIDYIYLPFTLDVSISGIGGNIGAGVDILFSPNAAFNIEARYFITKKIEEYWTVVGGRYTGNNFPSISWTIDEDWAAEINDFIKEEIDPTVLNPSFFKISVGIKVTF
jgi:hypothetical protein